MDNLAAKLKFTIIIVNFNTSSFLHSCLKSIYENKSSWPFEVIVVDNASQDGSPEMVMREFPQAKLIRNEENIGFGRANNRAMLTARGEYYLLLNSDVVVLPDSLDKMVKFMDDNLDAGVVTCKLLNTDMTLQKSIGDFPSLKYQVLSRIPFWARYVNIHDFDHDKLQQVAVFNGACYFLRREVIEKVGKFDEEFYLYAEETEWFYRMKKCGIKIFFLPEAAVVHYGGASIKDTFNRSLVYYRSLLLFFKKAYGIPALIILKIVSILSNIFVLFKLPFIFLIPDSKLKETKMNDVRLAWRMLGINLFFYP